MLDVMLFGHGWAGELAEVAKGARTLTQSSREPGEGVITFFITVWLSDDGVAYLTGTADLEPYADDIEAAVARWQPKPAPFPHY
ncbi:hypothetical protein ACN5L5_000242 [Cronobacter turicensis]|uniref:hypothetical protein n=1 Tax=Cronobacter turicensis TaxID=413502 RepID=UPI00029C6BF7|nr:hypothetical protein [Cronobacter turicensis]CCJ88358.1 FIG00554342: hypothetical protein [Cronobacter turicensis 564]ELY3542280.1 hypothetical protein [Cronobacter turicensis]ELY3625845.1 hypothetical protein [Cronobacter turicensis]ELY4777766.1 hypothetical protein [Cronobacter turicensis]NHV08901.1 hypothetical protein [Cronobacter turicensis]